MSKKSGYSYVSESSIDRNLLCGLCGKPFEDPRSLACNDVFCYACIHRRNEAGHLSCPSCRKFLQNTSVNQINRPLQNMLNDLRVKCLDCGQDDLKRGEFDKHLSSKCRKSNTVCSYTQDGDSLSGTREEVLEHSAQGGCPSQLKSEMLDVDERDLATGIESDAVLSDGGLNSDDGALSAAGDKKDDGSMMAAKNKAKDKAKSVPRSRLSSSTSSAGEHLSCPKCKKRGCFKGRLPSFGYANTAFVAYRPTPCPCHCHSDNVPVSTAKQ